MPKSQFDIVQLARGPRCFDIPAGFFRHRLELALTECREPEAGDLAVQDPRLPRGTRGRNTLRRILLFRGLQVVPSPLGFEHMGVGIDNWKIAWFGHGSSPC